MTSPCLSESLIRNYLPHVNGGPLALGKMVDVVGDQGAIAKSELDGVKQMVLASVKAMREREAKSPGWAARTFPEVPFDPVKPTRFVYNGLFRQLRPIPQIGRCAVRPRVCEWCANRAEYPY